MSTEHHIGAVPINEEPYRSPPSLEIRTTSVNLGHVLDFLEHDEIVKAKEFLPTLTVKQGRDCIGAGSILMIRLRLDGIIYEATRSYITAVQLHICRKWGVDFPCDMIERELERRCYVYYSTSPKWSYMVEVVLGTDYQIRDQVTIVGEKEAKHEHV